MALFKKRVKLEVYCGVIYDKYLSPEYGQQGGRLVADKMKEDLTQIDPSFADLNTERLLIENEYLRFEIFSLAWAERFLEDGNIIIEQTIFTKKYLLERERSDIWEGMEYYNKSVIGHKNTRIPVLREEFMKRYSNDKNDVQCFMSSASRYSVASLFNSNPGTMKYVLIRSFFREYELALYNHLGFSIDFKPSEEVDNYLINFLSAFYNECLASFNEIKI